MSASGAASAVPLVGPHGRVAALSNQAIVVAVAGALAAPNLVMAAAFRPGPAALVAVGTVAALALTATWRPVEGGKLAEPVDGRGWLVSVLCAIALLLLGGGLHVFYANPDWLIRDAVLADTVRTGVLSAYRVDGAEYLLRAPLGMYLVPALVGRGFGLPAAHVALLLQNALILGSILYLLGRIGLGWRHVALLVAFAGCGVLFRLLLAAMRGTLAPLPWIARPLDEWNIYFQYSSSITQFFWVPNHALPGWWLATLLLLYRRGEVDAAVLGVAVAAALIWSPLVVLVPVVFLLAFGLMRAREVLRSARTWAGAAAAAAFLPVAAYLTAASSTIGGGLAADKPDFALWYGLFLLFQLPACAYVAIEWRHLPGWLRPLFCMCTVVLVVLPFFSFGPGNDLVMRSSIPALVVVGFCFGEILLASPGTDARGRRAAGIALVLLSTPSWFVEVARAVTTPSFAVSSCGLMEATRALGDPGVPANYMARQDAMPPWLMEGPTSPPETSGPIACWPDLRRPDTAAANWEQRRALRGTIGPLSRN